MKSMRINHKNYIMLFFNYFSSKYVTVVYLPSVFRQTQALQEGLTASIDVPVKLIKTVSRIWQPLAELARCGNIQTKSDIQVCW